MNQPLKVFRVNNQKAKELSTAPNLPHEHGYEEIIVVIKGTIEHFIDFDSSILKSPFVGFITKGKTHRIKPIFNNEESDGFVIQFKSEFVSEIVFRLYHFFHNDAHVVFKTQVDFHNFVSLCTILHEEVKKDTTDHSITQSLLSTMLTILESEKRKLNNSIVSKNNDKGFTDFLKLLEENYSKQHDISFYSDQLKMSSRNLNIICQKILQKSITEIIQTRRLVQAKNLLLTTNKSIYEIGFEVGYHDKSYFSTIFKKKTGQSPSKFRSEMKNNIS